MAYTVQDAINATRLRLQDKNDKSYTDDEMLLYINDAQKDLSQVGCFRTTAQMPASTIHGRTKRYWHQFSLADRSVDSLDCTNIVRILRVSAGAFPAKYAPIKEEISWGVLGGDDTSPEGWTTWARSILTSGWDSDYAAEGALVYLAYCPVSVTGVTDALDIQEQLLPTIAAYVQYRCLQSSMDGYAESAFSEYEALKKQAMIRYMEPGAYVGRGR